MPPKYVAHRDAWGRRLPSPKSNVCLRSPLTSPHSQGLSGIALPQTVWGRSSNSHYNSLLPSEEGHLGVFVARMATDCPMYPRLFRGKNPALISNMCHQYTTSVACQASLNRRSRLYFPGSSFVRIRYFIRSLERGLSRPHPNKRLDASGIHQQLKHHDSTICWIEQREPTLPGTEPLLQ